MLDMKTQSLAVILLSVVPLVSAAPISTRHFGVHVAQKVSGGSNPSPPPLPAAPEAQGVLYYEPAAVPPAAPSPLSDSVLDSPLDSPCDMSAEQEEDSPLLPAEPNTTSLGSTSTSIVLPSSAVTSSSTSPSASASQISTQSSGSQEKPLVLAYFTDWTVWQRSPESIDYSKFDIIDFAFALPNEKFELSWDDPNASPSTLRRLVDSASKAGKRVILSIGGWTGSKFFSPAVATESSRQTFVQNVVRTYQDFKLSGIDIDWEYPGHQGEGSNLVSPNDSANFLAFLRLLRSSLPANALITAAVATSPFVDAEQRPMSDVSPFAEVLDFVTLMAYDTFSSSTTPGPNAPFSDACRNSTQPQANAVAAFDAWTLAGFPAEKLVLGIASYGYHSHSNATRLRSRDSQRRSSIVHTRQDDDGGQVTFNTLVKQGKLVKSASSPSSFVAGQNYTLDWDECSSTPFIYSQQGANEGATAGDVFTFDDPRSLKMKALWVKDVGMKGVNMWSLDGDTEEWDLVGAVREIFG